MLKCLKLDDLHLNLSSPDFLLCNLGEVPQIPLQTKCETVAIGMDSVRLDKLISVNALHNV